MIVALLLSGGMPAARFIGWRCGLTAAWPIPCAETTPSVKTQMAFVALLAPRCSNPEKAMVVVNFFRFAAEKEVVQVAMKKR